MKKQRWVARIMIALILLAGIATIFEASNPITTGRANRGSEWVLVASDDDVDGSAELITELDTSFVQLPAADEVEWLSSDTNDTTQTLYISGVNDANGKLVTVSGLITGSTVATSTVTFRYIDQIWLDKECIGTITVRKEANNALINSIEVGSLKGDVGQHFNGERVTYVKRWWATSGATTNTSVDLELRWYPDDADCLDATDGFMLLDRIFLAGVIYNSGIHPLGAIDTGIRLPAGGWLAVYGTGGAANQEVTVTVIGQDRRR